MKQNWDVPTKKRGPANPGGGDDDQSLVCCRVHPKGISKPRKHGEVEGIDEGHEKQENQELARSWERPST